MSKTSYVGEEFRRLLNTMDRTSAHTADMIESAIVNLVDVLEIHKDNVNEGYIVTALERVMKGMPLTPLTGEESEWKQGHGYPQINLRFPEIVKTKSGACVWVNGQYIVEEDGQITQEDIYVEMPFSVPSQKPIKLRREVPEINV